MKIIKVGSIKALFDDDTYKKYSECKIQFGSRDKKYLTRWNKGKFVLIHREIMGFPKGKQVDHINGNTFDNRRKNLRICSHSENQMNRGRTKSNKTGFKGVFLLHGKYGDYFIASIRVNGKSLHIKCCKSAVEAAKAYNEKAKELHKEFAFQNKV
jgi:HNH endonuclease